MGNLQAQDNTDIPVATQRSDTWPLEEIFIDGKLEVLDGRKIRNELRKEDEKRKSKEAELILRKSEQQ